MIRRCSREDTVAGVAEDSARERGSGVRVDQAVRGRDEGVRLRRRCDQRRAGGAGGVPAVDVDLPHASREIPRGAQARDWLLLSAPHARRLWRLSSALRWRRTPSGRSCCAATVSSAATRSSSWTSSSTTTATWTPPTSSRETVNSVVRVARGCQGGAEQTGQELARESMLATDALGSHNKAPGGPRRAARTISWASEPPRMRLGRLDGTRGFENRRSRRRRRRRR